MDTSENEPKKTLLQLFQNSIWCYWIWPFITWFTVIFPLKMLTFHCYVSFIHRLCFPIVSRIRCGSGCGSVVFCAMEIHGALRNPWAISTTLSLRVFTKLLKQQATATLDSTMIWRYIRSNKLTISHHVQLWTLRCQRNLMIRWNPALRFSSQSIIRVIRCPWRGFPGSKWLHPRAKSWQVLSHPSCK